MAASGKVKFTNSLQFSISIIILLVTLVILAGFAGFQFMNEKQQKFTSLENFTKNTSMRMSKYLANPMWAVEKDVIESLIESEMFDENVFGVLVFDSNGKSVVAGKARDKNWNVVKSFDVYKNVKIEKRDLFIQTKDIYMPGIKDKKLGSVKVFVTNQFAKRDLNKFLVNNLIAIVILNIILTLAIAVSLKRLLLNPLGMLMDATDKMSMGDLKTEITIESKNEIGVLAEGIERMRQSMILAFKRLQKR